MAKAKKKSAPKKNVTRLDIKQMNEEPKEKELTVPEPTVILPAIKEYILQNFGKMSVDELAMKTNMTVKQVEEIATESNTLFENTGKGPDGSDEDKAKRMPSGHVTRKGSTLMTGAAGALSDKANKNLPPLDNKKVFGDGFEKFKVSKPSVVIGE
jgi:hypothetical protein